MDPAPEVRGSLFTHNEKVGEHIGPITADPMGSAVIKFDKLVEAKYLTIQRTDSEDVFLWINEIVMFPRKLSFKDLS